MLSVKNLSIGFQYKDKVQAVLEGINFEIGKNEIVGLVGESGSGKSLTALSIMQLHDKIGAHFLSGEISFEGHKLGELKAKSLQYILGNEIAIVFQDPFASFNPLYSIKQHFEEQLKKHTTLRKEQRMAHMKELLEDTGLSEIDKILRSFPHELSGGMLQRVMIAMALSCNPKLLIADEITTALDATIQKKIIELLKKLQRKYELSILFITHDLSLIANIADRVLVMYAGHIVESSTCKDLFETPSHPYSEALINCLPEKNVGNENIHSIPGSMPAFYKKPQGCPFHPRCKYAEEICQSKLPNLDNVNEKHQARCILVERNKITA